MRFLISLTSTQGNIVNQPPLAFASSRHPSKPFRDRILAEKVLIETHGGRQRYSCCENIHHSTEVRLRLQQLIYQYIDRSEHGGHLVAQPSAA